MEDTCFYSEDPDTQQSTSLNAVSLIPSDDDSSDWDHDPTESLPFSLETKPETDPTKVSGVKDDFELNNSLLQDRVFRKACRPSPVVSYKRKTLNGNKRKSDQLEKRFRIKDKTGSRSGVKDVGVQANSLERKDNSVQTVLVFRYHLYQQQRDPNRMQTTTVTVFEQDGVKLTKTKVKETISFQKFFKKVNCSVMVDQVDVTVL